MHHSVTGGAGLVGLEMLDDTRLADWQNTRN